ncbi:MAG: helix-turn-helix transcriptional regulator, partial [Mycobacteriales bacterium]
CNRLETSGALVSALAHLGGDRETWHGARDPSGLSPAPPAAVEAVARAVQDDLTRNWALADLAAVARLDPAYLSRLCRQHLGIAPMRYVARLRAERAAVLLARTGLPVARVGAAVGWPEPNHFARRFKSLVGVSPTAYRLRAATGPGTSAH